jgi:DNA polymerase-3 subunit gamma/tau
MMATTELDKIPETVLSRAQVYEFRTIGTTAIADQLRTIAAAEGIAIGDESLQLIARDAEGSMRDAQSKLDQVIAFTGAEVSTEDVAAVLGLVGRDLLLDAVQAVVDEDAAAAFRLAARAVEMGYDLRAVCRELSRVVRDLLVLSVDPARVADPEIAGEGERDRLVALAARFSREDLLRAFDLLTRAEADIRGASQPRYHLEMALLRWMYLRKLVPIEDLLAGGATVGQPGRPSTAAAPAAARPAPPPVRSTAAPAPPQARPAAPAAQPTPAPAAQPAPAAASGPHVKDAFLAEIRKAKVVFYNTVVAQAQKIEVGGERITFTFSPTHRTLKDMFDQNRPWLESVAQQVSGRKLAVGAVQAEGGAPAASAADPEPAKTAKKTALREQALADAGVQAMLEVFPAEIRDVEEM